MCEHNNCIAGEIGGQLVRLADWDAAVVAFEAVIDDFNVRGQRQQINHPGRLTEFAFCTECGRSLANEVRRKLAWTS